MPTVTYNGQCFSIDNRPVWVLGATLHYARIPRELWAERIAAVRQAGFNLVETVCPWMRHEPRRGRYDFEGQADVGAFVEACAAEGLRVAIRLGPFVGDVYDGGGIPSWLYEMPEVELRRPNEVFYERAGAYIRKLAGALADLQVTKGGPILLVQCEHAWTCANDELADKYLKEIARLIRESGFDVPLTDANDLWPDGGVTVSTWRGWDDLLVHLRQLRTVQPEAPRLVSTFNAAGCDVWGEPHDDTKSADSVMRHLAEVLAAGAQLIVNPFHAGTSFGFDGGRLPDGSDRFITTSPHSSAPLGEAGYRSESYLAVRRLMTFANTFGHVFCGLDPDYQPVVLAPDETVTAGGPAIVPLRGAQGRVVFVFGSGKAKATTLLLDDGLRMPIHLGGQPVTWSVFDVDLGGAGRLDYSNLCPFTLVGRTLVLFGQERSTAYLSINRTPLQATVPSGKKPVVLEHHGLTVVVCSQKQIDVTYDDGERVYVGVSGIDTDGEPVAATGYARATVVHPDGDITQQTIEGDGARQTRSKTLTGWKANPATAHAEGTSPRYASLDGPSTLQACGASSGYGWYRVKLSSRNARKKTCHLPLIGDRLHVFLDGELLHVQGEGPGASAGPFDLKLSAGEHCLVGLADNLGRFCDGNDLGDLKGWFGHLYEVKALRAIKPKTQDAEVVDPFQFRPYISGLASGQYSDESQVVWSFSHARKAPILLEVDGAAAHGTFVMNDVLIAYYAGNTGARSLRMLLEPSEPYFRRGKNVLRFAPDGMQDTAVAEISKATTLYECTEVLSEGASWSFAKWEPPAKSGYQEMSKTAARSLRGTPCWWRTTVALPQTDAPVWFDSAGLSKGQLFLNGENVGRYFRAGRDGKAVGPQQRLYLPEPWIDAAADNELLVFDEHGFDPSRTRLVFTEKDEFA